MRLMTLSPDAYAARHCQSVINPLHSAVYFSPDMHTELGALAIERGSMAYFAIRAAPMGAVGAGVVTATFYNFSHTLVRRCVPRVWELATPAAVLEARLRITDSVMTRLLGAEALASKEMAEAAELTLRATEACVREARPLYAANADLDVPETPHLAFWHGVTLLREHRGDAHLAALAAAGLDGLEALVSHTATGKGFTPQFVRSSRGWSTEEWSAAQDRLRERGLLDGCGELTDAGIELRRGIESATDGMDLAPYRHLGTDAVARLTEIGTVFSGAALANGAFPMEHFGKG